MLFHYILMQFESHKPDVKVSEVVIVLVIEDDGLHCAFCSNYSRPLWYIPYYLPLVIVH